MGYFSRTKHAGIFLGIYLCCSFALGGQVYDQKTTDSLKKVTEKTNAPIDKVENLILLSKHYTNSNLDTFLILNQQALQIISENLKGLKVTSNEFKFPSRTEKRRLEEAKIKALSNVGFYHYNKTSLVKAINYYQQAEALARKINAKDLRADAILEMTHAKIEQGEYISAYEDLYQLLEQKDSLSKKTHAQIAHRLGRVFFRLENYDLSISYSQEALALSRELEDSVGIMKALLVMGAAYSDHGGTIDSIISLLNEALLIATRINSIPDVLGIKNNLGAIYERSGDLLPAEEIFVEILALSKKNNSKKTWLYASNLAEVYRQLGKLEEAEEAMKEFIPFLSDSSDVRMHMVYHGSASRILEAKGDWKSAYESKTNFHIWHEKFSNKEMNQKILVHELEVKQQKEKELLQAQHQHTVEMQKQKQKAQLAASIGSLFVVLAGMYFFMRHRQKVNRIEKARLVAEVALKSKEVELKKKELTSFSLRVNQNNEYMRNLEEITERMEGVTDQRMQHVLREMKNNIKISDRKDRDWISFQNHFNELNPSFVEKLTTTYPMLSSNEIRLCSLLKLNLTSNEIAALLGITMESLRVAKHRIHKKIELSRGEKLADFILKM